MDEEPDRIREQIESTRSNLTRNVDALADRTVPTRVAQRRWSSLKDRVRGVSDRVMGSSSSTAQSVMDRTSDAAQTMRERAGDTAQTMKERASDTASEVSDTIRRTPETVARQASGNPLAAGLIAFGAGLLTASLLPVTDAERRAGMAVKENAGDMVDRVREPLTESAQQLKQDVTGSVRQAAGQVGETARQAAQTTTEQAKSSTQDAQQTVREQV